MTALSAASVVAYGPLLLAIPIALLAGLVSFLSPCCLPLVPGYLAYVSGSAGADAQAASARTGTQSGSTKTRLHPSSTMVGTLLFVLGFATVFTSYGAVFGALGGALVRYNDVITRVLGAVTIVLGLAYAGLLSSLPIFSRTFRVSHQPKVGLLGAPLLGVLFGVGWTPCIGPTLAVVLSLSTNAAGAGRGALLSFVYSLGLGLPFLLAAAGVTRAFRVFGWARTHALLVMRAGGLLLVLVGVLEVTGIWGLLVAQLQGVVANWQSPL